MTPLDCITHLGAWQTAAPSSRRGLLQATKKPAPGRFHLPYPGQSSGMTKTISLKLRLVSEPVAEYIILFIKNQSALHLQTLFSFFSFCGERNTIEF